MKQLNICRYTIFKYETNIKQYGSFSDVVKFLKVDVKIKQKL